MSFLYWNSQRISVYPTGMLFVTLLVFSACQSPTETPPNVDHIVIVRVQDSLQNAVPSAVVEVYEGTTVPENATAMRTAITNDFGETTFTLAIPQSGGAYTFVAIDQQLGKRQVSANLLCRDTILIIAYDTKRLTCNVDRSDSLTLADLCVYNGGLGIADSTQVVYKSECSVPLTMTYTSVNDPYQVRLFAIDEEGNAISGNSFVLQPFASFAVRLTAKPNSAGKFSQTATISGTGPGGASLSISLQLSVSAVDCEGCPCIDTIVNMSFANTQVSPSLQTAIRTLTFLKNQSLCNRQDRLIQGPTNPEVFRMKNSLKSVVGVGESQQLQIEFAPTAVKEYRDSLLIETFIPDNGKRCTTKVILSGSGCAPECCMDKSGLSETEPNVYTLDMSTRSYENVSRKVCFKNCGSCGTIEVSHQLQTPTKGFTATPERLSLGVNQEACFTVQFEATDELVWPNGHGRPAVVDHYINWPIEKCGPLTTIRVHVHVDTIPILYSRCVYVWSDNEKLGFNFTPAELKGSEIYDVDPINNQITDFVVDNITVGVEADVYIRSGWKWIDSDVTEMDFNFANISATWPSYPTITKPPFDSNRPAVFEIRSAYSIEINRGGTLTYALIRVREISVDGDGKRKVCLDVLYPMIKE